jgi:hypothetical protein
MSNIYIIWRWFVCKLRAKLIYRIDPRTDTKLGPEAFRFTDSVEARAIKQNERYYILRSPQKFFFLSPIKSNFFFVANQVQIKGDLKSFIFWHSEGTATRLGQGCWMVCFQTKNINLGKF